MAKSGARSESALERRGGTDGVGAARGVLRVGLLLAGAVLAGPVPTTHAELVRPLPLDAPADVAPTGELASPWDGPGAVPPPGIAQQAGPAVPGADIRVFPSDTPQTEMSIAVNPANPANLLITSNTSGSSPQGYYFSFDGGQTWGGSNDYPNGILSRGDPVSVFDADGVAYDVTLLASPVASVARVRSLDGGVTWDDFRILDPGAGGIECDDKEHAVVDTDDASPFRNSFYAAWTDFSFACIISLPGYVRVVFTTSNDDFSVRHVLDEQFGFDIGQGVNIQVGAEEGQVYVIWSVYTGGQLPETGMGFTRSVDGGLTFQPPIIAFPYSGIRTMGQGHPSFNGTRVNSFPSMAVDHSFGPHRGRIYVAYADRSTGDSDVYARYSDTQGALWSAPTRVNPDPPGNGQQQWFPWLSCDPSNGSLNIVYYSMDQPSGFATRAWAARSTDGGASFEAFPLSDVPFTPAPLPGFAPGYMGDYLGITAFGGLARAAWTDNRFGPFNLFVDSFETTGGPATTTTTTVTPSSTTTTTAGNPCLGRCGGSSTVNGQPCWCDALCASYGDCCGGPATVCAACPNLPFCGGVTTTTIALSTTTTTTQPAGNVCGNGVCSGSENGSNCGVDCCDANTPCWFTYRDEGIFSCRDVNSTGHRWYADWEWQKWDGSPPPTGRASLEPFCDDWSDLEASSFACGYQWAQCCFLTNGWTYGGCSEGQ